MIFEAISGLLAIFVAFRLYKVLIGYFEYKRLVAAGIPFPNGFSYFQDLKDLNEVI
jgi:hypothetical protein